MYDGEAVASLLAEAGFTHVVWLPDSTFGRWEAALERREELRLVRVCREGEAWGVAAGLHLGGATPVVLIQCTGLFESGDALRNVLFDFRLPLYALIGYRNALNEQRRDRDTARLFAEPILQAWGLDYRVVGPEDVGSIAEHVRHCRAEERAGVSLLGEGTT